MARSWHGWTLAIATMAFTGAATPASAALRAVVPALTLPADTVVDAIVARSEGAIRDDLQIAHTARERAERQYPEAQAGISTAKARLEIRKKEIELVGKQIDLAKKEKNDGARARYERDRNVLDRQKKLLEAEIELAEEWKNVVEARRDLAREEVQSFEREMQLRIARPDGNLDAQRKLLESMAKTADRREELGRREKRLVDKQFKVLDAAREISRG